MEKFKIENNSFLLKILIVFLGANIGITVGISGYLASTAYAHVGRPHTHPQPMTDIKFKNAFNFDPTKGEKAHITYTLKDPAYVSVRVLRKGTRELFLNTIVSFEYREAGVHTETWNGKDYNGNTVKFKETPFEYRMEAEIATNVKQHTEHEFKGVEYEEGDSQKEVIEKSEFKGRHIHGEHEKDYENIPLLHIYSPKANEVLKGIATINSAVDKDRRGYGNKYGYGVRYYVDKQLVHEEFYKSKSGGNFKYELDTTAFDDGKHLLYIGLCDHNDHVTSQGIDIVINNFSD